MTEKMRIALQNMSDNVSAHGFRSFVPKEVVYRVLCDLWEHLSELQMVGFHLPDGRAVVLQSECSDTEMLPDKTFPCVHKIIMSTGVKND